LIPRPETADVFTRLAELISSNDHFRLSRANPSGGQERAEKHNKNPVKILDLYTGSGCIALLISHLLQPRLAPHSPPQLQLLGIDLNPLSIHLAHKNAQSLSIPTSSARFVEGDITHPEFPHVLRTQGWWGQVDLILANPPYIPLGEYEGLDLSVRGWEDRGALVGFDRDGLGHYRVLAGMVRGLIEGADVGDEHERTNVRTTPWDLAGLPRLAVEIGDGQGQTVERLLVDESQGYLRRTECWRDGWGRERLVVGWTTG
jgi:release factor glutamine methyltransferase